MTTTRDAAARSGRPRSYLMCPPDHYSIDYAINPWMDLSRPADAALAGSQWLNLVRVLRGLGHQVQLAAPEPGLPDMVFAANAAVVLDGRVLVASFRNAERAGESAAYEAWFGTQGYQQVRRAREINEGEGDHLVVGGLILAGNGMRTSRASHGETSAFFGRPVVGLTLVDERFYHLDTALCVLGDREIMYYPGAFSPDSLRRLRELFPDAIEAEERDAEAFGLNAISDGRHVVMSAAATHLAARLAERGYEPVPVEIGEMAKAGGGPKCCVLELRPYTAAGLQATTQVSTLELGDAVDPARRGHLTPSLRE